MVYDSSRHDTRKLVLAGLVGNVMEWYDFAVYGYFAAIIAPQFFPSKSPAVSLIAAFGAFAAGFLVRPLGGLVFGRIGDLVGRRKALLLSVMAMAIPTVLIGCLPNYEHIGVLAPVLIVLLRIVQGLSVGGEYTCLLVFLAEHAPDGHRARTTIWDMWRAQDGRAQDGAQDGTPTFRQFPTSSRGDWGAGRDTHVSAISDIKPRRLAIV